MQEPKFFVCDECHKIIQDICCCCNDCACNSVSFTCDGKPMKELTANSTDAAVEKHVPVVSEDGGKVHVSLGEVTHPMEDKHFIEWVYVKSNKGGQIRYLAPGNETELDFSFVTGDTPQTVYAYCNLHGLWKKDL